MMWKVIIGFALVTIVASIPIEVHHTLHPSAIFKPIAVKALHVEEDGPAEYEFSYAVHDEKTGDIKSHKESRKGDAVKGSYELIDSDGYRRLVEYTADDHNGFQAIVHREPTDIKIPIPEKKEILTHASAKLIAAPIYHVAPVSKLHIAPIYHKISEPTTKLVTGNHVSFAAPSISYHY